MKLSTRSRYGTRLMLDMAQHYREGPIHLGDIAKRQDVSVKYLEQIIIPLKKAHYIESVRGSKGGHILTKPPEEITVGEIVATPGAGHRPGGVRGGPHGLRARRYLPHPPSLERSLSSHV